MDKRLAPVAFTAPAQFAAAAEDGTRRFQAVAYGGGVITDHPLWARVAFDISSTKLRTPAVMRHEHGGEVGVADKATLNGTVGIEGKIFSDVDETAKMIVDKADRGMPWQMSVRIHPGRLEQIKAGAKVELNGQTLDGPLTVFRNNRIREVSFCALGADDQTSAEIFTIGGDEPRPKEPAMEFTQADIDAAVNAERAVTASEKARADKATEDLKTLEGKFNAQTLSTRTAAVKQLFVDTGREFKDDVAKPYLEMPDEAFSAVAKDLRAAKPKADPSLFTETTTTGADPNANDVDSIRAKARKFIADQFAADGRVVSISDAVTFVTKKAA